jgi:hypothetical protein
MMPPVMRPPTPSQTIGPFWHLLGDTGLADLTRPGDAGPRIELAGQVFDGAGAPITDACIEIWQATPAASPGFPIVWLGVAWRCGSMPSHWQSCPLEIRAPRRAAPAPGPAWPGRPPAAQCVSRHSIARTRSSTASTAAKSAGVM